MDLDASRAAGAQTFPFICPGATSDETGTVFGALNAMRARIGMLNVALNGGIVRRTPRLHDAGHDEPMEKVEPGPPILGPGSGGDQ